MLWRIILAIFIGAAALIIPGLECGMMNAFDLAGSDPEPRTAALIDQFGAHRKEFDAIARFTRRDKLPVFTDVGEDDSFHRNVSRLHLHRDLIHAAGLTNGAQLTDDRILRIPAWMHGWAGGTDYAKGFAYAAIPPTGQIVPNLDRAVTFSGQSAFCLYQHLAGNWYFYFEQLPG
jgi:hypothetical protein